MTFVDRLANYVLAGFPCLSIQTSEEARALGDVLAVARKHARPCFVWSATEGVQKVLPSVQKVSDSTDLVAACKLTAGTQYPENAILVLRDPHTWPFERDPELLRAFRDMLQDGPKRGGAVVVIAHDFRPHPTIERLVTILDYALPDQEDLGRIIRGIVESTDASVDRTGLVTTADVLRALGGLSTAEAENALALSIIETGRFDAGVIYREKVAAVKRSGLLEVVESDPRGLEAIGGMETVKAWIQKRRRAYVDEAAAQEFGCAAPKGILVVGVPGGGKSLLAKVVGTALGMPTLKLDIGSMFNSLVGESESRMRSALALVEAMAPCVLQIDEIEKGLAGSGGSGDQDSGVGKRVLGTILTWMQDRKRPVFVIASANGVEQLPAELLRAGRWDALFAVDLPDQEERQDILGIHLRARKRDPGAFDLRAVCEACDQFTGSEIEAVVTEALYDAFDRGAGSELSTADLVAAARRTVPLAVTAKERIAGIREWARTRARFAGKAAPGPGIVEEGPRRRIVGAVLLTEGEVPATTEEKKSQN